ncbi:parallel beta-helix domain-containing protein [Bermanella sp. R86510]|uniref:parallel beta-helix domain-containing protein n=1 Tax=unclassified Bermanella TaxID=2627862 RepID=UPI0037C79EC4
MKITKTLQLATAIATSTMLIACGSSSDNSSPSMSMAANSNESVVALTAIADTTCFNANQCSASGYTFPEDATMVEANDGEDITNKLLAAINDAGEDAVIVLPKGTFTVTKPVAISAAQTGLTLVGHGIDETKLDFSESTADDGMKLSGTNNIVLRDFAVYGAAKNGIKVDQVNGIHFNYVAAIWEAPLTAESEENGTNGIYGLYPVGSDNVLIENSYSKGSVDAGIYVGQSNNIVVRNNVAEHNIAGIEIENSSNADVYKNVAFDNTGGILIFDLPGLDKAFGSNVRIFDNHAYDNNLANVGSGFVGLVPKGTGSLVLASDGVEIYNNQFDDNDGQAIAITSYVLVDDDLDNYGNNYSATIANGWTPITNNIYIHDNKYKNNSADPDLDPETSLLAQASLGYLAGENAAQKAVTHPAIIYDGIGELLTRANQLSPFGIPATAYDGNKMCVEDSVDQNDNGSTLNIGSVYGVNPVDTNNFDSEMQPTPTLRVGELGSDSNTVMSCAGTPTRLTPSIATIDGVKYGCGADGDDEDSASCNL